MPMEISFREVDYIEKVVENSDYTAAKKDYYKTHPDEDADSGQKPKDSTHPFYYLYRVNYLVGKFKGSNSYYYAKLHAAAKSEKAKKAKEK